MLIIYKTCLGLAWLRLRAVILTGNVLKFLKNADSISTLKNFVLAL